MSVARGVRRALILGVLGSSVVLFTGVLPSISCSGPAFVARFNSLRSDAYPLDEFDRDIVADAGLECPDVELVTHRGEALRYEPAVRVTPPFLDRLQRFEAAVTTVAVAVYGRAPRAIRNAGAYSCRAVRHRSYRLSEHALGNALDVIGFRFEPLPRDVPLPAGAPESLRAAFSVDLVRAWKSNDTHRRFADELFRELQTRNVFRAMLGPGHEAHRDADHFHFDCGPWPVIQL